MPRVHSLASSVQSPESSVQRLESRNSGMSFQEGFCRPCVNFISVFSNGRSSRRGVFCEIGILKNFAKFAENRVLVLSGGKKCLFFGKFSIRTKWTIPNEDLFANFQWKLKSRRNWQLSWASPGVILKKGKWLVTKLHWSEFLYSEFVRREIWWYSLSFQFGPLSVPFV